jgi:hypothetical protein
MMPDPQIIESLAAAPAAEPFAGIVVQLEANDETAQILVDAATRSGGAQRVVVTYKGLAIGEVIPAKDPRILEYLKGRATGRVGVPAGAVKPAAPDADWQARWEALQARALREIGEELTEEEIEAAIQEASQEARSERVARSS